MNVQVNKIDDLNLELTIGIEAADYAEIERKKLAQRRKTADFKGFRKGNVPASLIKKVYGEQCLVEAVNAVIADALDKHISENNLQTGFDNDINKYIKYAIENLTSTSTGWSKYVFTQTGSMYYTLRTRKSYYAFAIGIDKNGNPVGVDKCDALQLEIKDRLITGIRPSVMGLFDIADERLNGSGRCDGK